MSQVQTVIQPRRLGRYTLIERLGIGGQSEVWRVSDETADAQRALKVLSSKAARSSKAWAALEHEYAASALLRHPGILQVLPPERIEGTVVLPMELADGGSLSRLRGSGYLEIVPVLLEVTHALSYAHARGVVHRDLKPGNVLLDRNGRAKLADFGLAVVLAGSGAEQTLTRAWGGSPFSASPGQLRGESASAADDIYGLGAMTYELLAGRPPYFPNFGAGQIRDAVVPPLVPIRPTPVQLIELVMRMLAKDPQARPSSMHQVASEFEMSLNATLVLDLTEQADLSMAAASASATESLGGAARACDPVEGFFAPPRSTAALPRACTTEPASVSTGIEPVLRDEALNPLRGVEDVGPLHGMYPLGSGGWHVAGGGPRSRPHRLRYGVIGVICGVGVAAGALQWFADPSVFSRVPQMLASAVSSMQVGPSAPAADRPPEVARPAVRAPSAGQGAARPGRALRAQGARRLDSLSARGAAQRGAHEVAAAKHQAAGAQSGEQAREPVRAARRLHNGNGGRRALERRAPLAAALKSGRTALASGRLGVAARSFALARRIDVGSRLAAEGERQVRALQTVRPLLSEARRAERAGHYSRALFYYRQVVAREPGYAPARAAVRRVREAFGTQGYQRSVRAGLDALAGGRLYDAQADFQQALVYRPQGIKAATELSEVNTALRHRESDSHGVGPRPSQSEH